VIVGGAAAVTVLSMATGVLAAPSSAPVSEVAANETLTPVLHGQATAPGTGSETIHFSARTVGSATWNLLNDVVASGRDAYRALPADQLSIGQAFEFQISHCDATGCTAAPVQTGYVSPDLAAGKRPGATRTSFTMGDRISAQVDVGTGNLLVTTSQLTLRRINGATVDLGLAYNGLTLAPGSRFDSSISPGWRFSTGSDVRLKGAGGGRYVTYYGPGGVSGVFTRKANTTDQYDSPKSVKGTLTGDTTNGWTLEGHGSGDKLVFNRFGWLTAVKDRKNNQTTFNYDSAGHLTRVRADLGTDGARTVDVTLDGSDRIATLTQTADATHSRSASYAYDSNGRLESITDVLGRNTTFGYNASGDLASITAPGGAQTTFEYDAQHRATVVNQPSAGTDRAVTRFVYHAGAGADSTLVADPNTDQGQAVADVPHTTYDLSTDDGDMAIDGMRLVSKVTDPAGHERSKTYTPFYDVETATNTGGTTTFGYTANSGESLTSATAPTSGQVGYEYTAPGAPFSPSSREDAQGNTTTWSYDSTDGSFTGGTDGNNASAEITRNSDGTVDTATSPSGAVTNFNYDTVHQLTGITPPTGNSLQVRSYGYDAYGRIETYTVTRDTTQGPVTQTFSYDDADRVTEVNYSDSTPSVSYSYDTAGRVQTRTDASGITTYTYDPLGRLAARAHTAGGGTLTYGYDLAGNLTSETDANGTTTHSYDERNLLVRTETPDNRMINFAYDGDGRRTDTWFATDASNYGWAARTHVDYDASGRISRMWTARASNNNTRVSDLTYSYAAPGTGWCAFSPPAGQDTSLRWRITDNLTSNTTTNCYDKANRLLRSSSPAGDTWVYTYDASGNRTKVTKNGVVQQQPMFNSANQISSTGYGYDGAGNLTASPGSVTLSYNGSDQLTGRSGGASGSYTYAGSDQKELISQTVPGGGTIAYTWGRADGNGLPVLDSLTNASGTSYLTHDDNGNPLAIKSYNGGVAYYVLDGLGSPVALVNSSGTMIATYTYDPYGGATVNNITGASATAVNPYRFAGGLNDRSTGYVKYGLRYYDPGTGRFTQQDSVEVVADPARGNRYQYAGSNPVNNVDPTGRYTITLSVDACYVVCLSLGVSVDDTGDYGLTLATGLGSPGIGGGLTFGTGTVDSGLSASLGCSAGPFTASVGLGQEVSVGAGTYASTPTCSGLIGYTFA
jgi:RHS repeat-associated protein